MTIFFFYFPSIEKWPSDQIIIFFPHIKKVAPSREEVYWLFNMTQEEQQEAFLNELWALIDRYRDQFDLTVCSAIGVLETVKMQVLMEEVAVDDLEEE
jgi:hypothetical protein